jgi:hypothetical protein
VASGWWLVAVAGGWWLVAGGWWLDKKKHCINNMFI